MNLENGYWLLPTRRRASRLQALFDKMMVTKISTPGLILVQTQEFSELAEQYESLVLPPNWRFFVTNGEGMAAKVQEGWQEICKEAEWVGVICDDNLPQTLNWDSRLVEQLQGWDVISSNDGWQAPTRIHGATVWSADLVRAAGYLSPPGLRHLFFDNVWETIGAETKCLRWDMEIMVSHEHASLNGHADSTVKAVNAFWGEDRATYDTWRTNMYTSQNRYKAVASVLDMMHAKGVLDAPPDLKGVSLQIATPCGDGRYERVYMKSWFNTISLLRDLGAEVDWAEIPYCADIAFARAKILGNFRRSPHTHLLFIDSDMGWSPSDVVRLLLTKRDFVAAAGPKKVEIPQFAVNVTDENSRPSAVHHEIGTGLIEVSEVGGAFVMVTKACVERMCQHYADLAFKMPDGEIEHALFDPTVVNGFRRGEDFAFCQRWRALGGKIYVMADIRLDHVGSKTWTGAWMDTFRPIAAMQDAAE